MQSASAPLLEHLYQLLVALPRLDHTVTRGMVPQNGIYLFFERGEVTPWRDSIVDRVVRVGTHRGDGNFYTRIRTHYGRVRSLGGNKNSSVFRKHIGGALLRKADPSDPRLSEWLTQGGRSFPDVEERVSRTLRDTFTFVSIRVDTAQERLLLEENLIALLAQQVAQSASPTWLGNHAADPNIPRTGLWNSHQVSNGLPLDDTGLRRLVRLMDQA